MGCLNPIEVERIVKGQKCTFVRRDDNTDNQPWLTDREWHTRRRNLLWQESQFLPCRKCIQCKLDNAREWSIRCALQVKTSPSNNWFVTLTYDNDHLPVNDRGIPTVRNDELTAFIKRLRKHFERRGVTGIKYLASTEYGSKTKRPHYHACFFGLPLDDLKQALGRKSYTGDPYLESPFLTQLWGKGMVVVGTVTYASAGYVARYTLKKQSKIDYENLGIEPERLRMSKGIGLDYFNQNWQTLYFNDHVTFKNGDEVVQLPIPRYYDRRLEKERPDILAIAKRERIAKGKVRFITKHSSTDIPFTQQLGNAQHSLYEKIKKLKRNVDKS